MTEKWGMAAMFLLGILLGLVIASAFFNNQVKIEAENSLALEVDTNYLDTRFDRIEAGILNASQDKCALLGGKYPIDANGPTIYQFDFLVDENTNTFQRVPMWPCLFFPKQ